MKRKALRVKSPRKKTFSKPALNRAIDVAQAKNLSIAECVLGNDGTARLIFGTGKTNDTKKNEWDTLDGKNSPEARQ